MSTFHTLPAAEQAITIDSQTADGVFVKQVTIPKAGSFVPQHAHLWDHTTLLTNGALTVWCDGVLDRDYIAPAMIHIPAGVKHLFRSMRDNTVFWCIHNLKSAQVVEVLEEHNLVDEEV